MYFQIMCFNKWLIGKRKLVKDRRVAKVEVRSKEKSSRWVLTPIHQLINSQALDLIRFDSDSSDDINSSGYTVHALFSQSLNAINIPVNWLIQHNIKGYI